MINRHTVKTYALSTGWTYIPSNLAEGEEFVKGKYRISIPTVDDIDDVFMDDVLNYAIDQICSEEKTSLLTVINNIANTWLPFDYHEVQPIKDYCLLLKTFGETRAFTAQEAEVFISDHEVIDKLLWMDQGENALSDMPFLMKVKALLKE
jgi:hypothetical protein